MDDGTVVLHEQAQRHDVLTDANLGPYDYVILVNFGPHKARDLTVSTLTYAQDHYVILSHVCRSNQKNYVIMKKERARIVSTTTIGCANNILESSQRKHLSR